MNRLILSGRLTKDFELKNEVARSSIAVDTFKGDAMFVDITAFKHTADYCVKYLRKGDMVVIDGELNVFKKDTKVYVSCSIQNIQGLGGSKKQAESKPQTEEKEIVTNDSDVVDISDEDLPF